MVDTRVRQVLIRRVVIWVGGILLVCAALVVIGLLSDLGLPPWARILIAMGLAALAVVTWGAGLLGPFSELMAGASAPAAGMTGAGPAGPRRPMSATRIIILYVLALFAIGCGVILASEFLHKTSALLWALAAMAGGGFVGFLFGIPRVLQDGQSGSADPHPGVRPEAPTNLRLPSGASAPSPSAGSGFRINVNTNLEQISDWLTKIIVGLGLVELRNMPGYLRRATDFLARGLASPAGSAIPLQESRTISAALLIFFTLLGFLGIYMITRLYLAHQFGLADLRNVMIGRTPMTPSEAAAQIASQVTDLQGQVIEIKRQVGVKPGGAAGAVAPAAAGSRRILWAHEDPQADSFTGGQLIGLGFEVEDVGTTAEALDRLKVGGFGLVISDMARTEGLGWKETAGLELLRQVRRDHPALPIALFCSPARAEKYRPDVAADPHALITSSPTDLIDFASRILGRDPV